MIVALVAAVVSSVLLQCYVVSADEISPSTMRLMVTKNALDYSKRKHCVLRISSVMPSVRKKYFCSSLF